MKIRFFLSIFLIISIQSFLAKAQRVADRQEINPDILNHIWPACWISCPETSPFDYAVYHFRKTFNLNSKPDEFIIHISADNRYILYVNGIYVTYGPARGDLQHWRFESLNIAGLLHKGSNTIAAQVWNFGQFIPFSQMTRMTGFIMAGNGTLESLINTGPDWKVMKNEAYQPVSGFSEILHSFIVTGPGDHVDGSKYPWGWEKPSYNDSRWSNAQEIVRGKPRTTGTDGDWMLVPREIELMRTGMEPFQAIRRSDGILFPVKYLDNDHNVEIPANSSVSFLLDQGHLIKSFPRLVVSNGRDAEIRITYAEALYDDQGLKGNRNDIEGKEIKGNYDVFIADGGKMRMFSPLWFRTYRYVKVEIITSEQPLFLHQILSLPTGFPLRQRSEFSSDDEELSKIWEVGFRTARLCAGEIYYDCPYYEQMQYVGDTRIQALISLYVDGNDQLMRKAIKLFDDSRLPIGLTQSRYPSSAMQLIPPYSLFWIDMVHDYWMYRNDPVFVRSFLTGIQDVLNWFEQRLDQTNMLGPLEWWNFVDWADEWPWNENVRVGGVPYGVAEGHSSNISLQFAYALDRAAELFAAFNDQYHADKYRDLSVKIKQATFEQCWESGKQLLADSPEKKFFSQHANIFGILTDAVPVERQVDLMQKILDDSSLIQCTLYFRFYLVEALRKTGLADQYVETLGPWKKMLRNGLTTFAEKPDPTRSDCHAWSASPNFDFLATVCGFMPAVPGFKKVRISPHPGYLNSLKGRLYMPEYNDYIELEFNRKDGRINCSVKIPEDMTGVFEWKGRKITLGGGKQKIDL